MSAEKIARQGLTARHIGVVVTMALTLLTAVGIIFTAAGLCYRPVSEHFGVPVSQVSLYITFVYLGQMAGAAPMGYLFDRFSAKSVCVAAALMVVVPYMGFAFYPAIWCYWAAGFVIGLELAKSGVEKILHPQDTALSPVTAAVLALSIAVKLWLASFNRTLGKKIDSAALLATAADSRNDVISTAAVLVSLAVSALTHWQLDGWMGLAVALFILVSGAKLVKETLDPILGEAPSEELTDYIAKKVLSYDGVLGTHDLMVHDYGPGRRFASVHVEMDAGKDVMESHDIIDNIERDFHDNDNIHLVIHYDPIATGDEAVGTLRAWTLARVREISPQLSIHDFRMVAGPSHTNLIFDVSAPTDFPMDDATLKAAIAEKLAHGDDGASYYAVVTVDRSFAPFHNDADERAQGL